MNIQHRKNHKGGSFYYEQDGKQLAEMAYVTNGDAQLIIEHTEVDPSLRGQGVGKKLQAELINYVRANKLKVIPLCPFANTTFQRVKEWQDVLV